MSIFLRRFLKIAVKSFPITAWNFIGFNGNDIGVKYISQQYTIKVD